MKYIILIPVTCLLTLLGCKQVTNTIKETFRPLDTARVVKTEQKKTAPPDVNASIESQIQTVNSIIQTHTSRHIEIHIDKKDKQFLSSPSGLEKAEKMLRNLPAYAGKEILIYQSIHFYGDGSINVMLKHPTQPAYVDKYSFANGKWSAPSPVQLSAKEDINSKMVPLDKIRFKHAYQVARLYNEKALTIEGAKPTTTVYVSIWDNKMRWFPSVINGSRERYSISFNEDGSLKQFSRD